MPKHWLTKISDSMWELFIAIQHEEDEVYEDYVYTDWNDEWLTYYVNDHIESMYGSEDNNGLCYIAN